MRGLPCDIGTRGCLTNWPDGQKMKEKEPGWTLAGYVYWSINDGAATPLYAHDDGREYEGGVFWPDA